MAPKPIKGRRRANTRRWVYGVGAAGGAAVLALLAIVGGLIGGDTEDPPIVVPAARPAGLAQEGHVLGSPSAPVTITEYADFQ
jgi:protein-disulfide isomerase